MEKFLKSMAQILDTEAEIDLELPLADIYRMGFFEYGSFYGHG